MAAELVGTRAEALLPKQTTPYITNLETLALGKRHGLATATYINPRDPARVERKCDFIFLQGSPPLEPVGTLMPNVYRDEDGTWCTILVRQFRPNYQEDTMEFPAGFIERKAGETAEGAAVREMEEETTKTGTVLATSPDLTAEPVPVGARLVGVLLHAVDKTGDEAGKQRLDKGEFAIDYTIPLLKLESRLKDFQMAGVVIDPRVWTFAMGIKCALMVELHKAA